MGHFVCKCTDAERQKCKYEKTEIYKCARVFYMPDGFDDSYKKGIQKELRENRFANGETRWQ